MAIEDQIPALGAPRPSKEQKRRAKQDSAVKPSGGRSIDRKLGVSPPDLEATASRPAPAFGVTRENKPTGAKLYERYGLVYDPEAEKSPITQAERDALTELYSAVTGRDIALEDDTLSALERNNLIMRRASRRRALDRLGGKDNVPEFASAADALDWMRAQGEKADGPGPLSKAVDALADRWKPGGDGPEYGPSFGEVFDKAFDPIVDKTAEGLGNLADGARFVAPFIGQAASDIGNIPEPKLTADGPKNSTIGENLRTTGRALASALDKGVELASNIGDAPITLYGTGFSVTGQPGGVKRRVPTTSRPAPRDRLRNPQVTLRDVIGKAEEVAANPNSVVDVATDQDTFLPDADPRVNAASEAAQRGARLEEINSILMAQGPDMQNAASPFTGDIDVSMRGFAKKNGWDDTEWAQLTPAEKLFRANTKYDYLGVFGRNLVRSIGETGAVPASLKAITDATAAAFRGDPNELYALVEAAISPFVQARDTQQKRGAGDALLEFFRDDPAYALLIVNSALRTGSRVAGIASRAGGYTVAEPGRVVTARGPEVVTPPKPRDVPELPTLPGQARQREWINARVEGQAVEAENARRQAAWDAAGTPEEERAAGDVFATEIPVGVTTGRLFNDAVMLPLRAKIAERWDWYGSLVSRRAAERFSRRELNAVQGVSLELSGILERALATQEGKRLRRPVDEWTKNRAAFNLVWAQESIDGKPITPGVVADYFKAQQEELLRGLGGKGAKGADRAQIAYWSAQEKFFRRLDEVEIDDSTMARLREAARPLGEANDKIVAAALGISVKEVKRANYIRLLVLDPKFEATSQARKRMVNLEPVQLQIAQRKIRRASEAFLQYADANGWGKKGPTASRRRYEQMREQLIVEMQTARRLAESLGDDELVRVLDDGLAKMRLARNEATARATNLRATFDALDDLRLSDEQVRALSPEGRAAYEAAQAAEQDVARLRGEQQAALDELGAKRTTGATVLAAQRKLEEARANLESARSFPTPDADAVARAEARVRDAQDRLARVEAAQATKEPLRVAELSRDQKVREAKRIINQGQTVLDDGEITAALSVAGDLAAVRIRTRKDFAYYTIERARNETLDEFIARVEAQDKNPVLHLVQTRAFDQLGSFVMVEGGRRLRGDTMARVRAGRLQASEGYTFARGYEDPSMWRNLMFDTSELQSSAMWSEKVTDLLNATSLRFEFTPATLERAAEVAETLVDDDSGLSRQSRALAQFVNAESINVDMREYVVVPKDAPGARRPSERVDLGALRQMQPESIGELTIRQLTERDIDPNAPGDYYLVPRAVYDGIMKAVEDESFRFRPPRSTWSATSGWQYRLDKMTRAWRTLTLNVFPRTAVVNTAGSTILAIQAGAGPRAMQYAAMALLGIEMRMPDGSMRQLPVPPELRQRYYEQQLTDPVTASRMRLDELPDPNAKDAAFAWAAWYMNTIRHINGMSEDFGRLAVWYSKAYPEAMRNAPEAKRFMLSARSLNNGAMDLLESMARGDDRWRTQHQAWMQQAFDFLGDLHKGGPGASRMRIAIPFWQWYWHMLKLTFFTMPLKYPGRALFLQMLGDIGAQYQEEHGVVVPWAWGFIPFMTSSEQVGMGEQLVTGGVDVGNVYPQITFGQYFLRDGSMNLGKAVQDSVNPLMSNTSLILWSALPGTDTVEFDDKAFVKAAKDEFGINVGGPDDSQFWNYLANRVFRMVPLSPSLMSSMGRASTAFPFPGQMSEKYRSPETLVREGELNARADVTDLGFDWRPWAKFLSKIFIGARYDELEGVGPIWRQQMLRDAERLAREKTMQEKKMAERMQEAFNGNYVRGVQP